MSDNTCSDDSRQTVNDDLADHLQKRAEAVDELVCRCGHRLRRHRQGGKCRSPRCPCTFFRFKNEGDFSLWLNFDKEVPADEPRNQD